MWNTRNESDSLGIATETLDNINDVFARMHQGDIEGRVVIDFQKESSCHRR